MSDEEYEPATPEQKLNISNYFIMSSPTGEVHDVLIDVAKLANDPSVLNDGAVKRIMKDYNLDQLQPAKTPEGKSLIVSQYNQQSDNEFADFSTGKVYTFDHKKHTFAESDKKVSLSGAIEGYRAAIQSALDEYNGNQYKSNKCVINVFGKDDGSITICLSARNTNLGNFWTGGWRSTFSLNVKAKGASEMKCNTKVNVHYFEDGNVQLHSGIEKTASINVADEASTAKEIVTYINNMESDFQSNMEEMYVDMHRVTFKAMRRFLPITQQPMNWNSAAHNIQNKVK